VENHLIFEGLSLTVESVERSLDFYSGQLGLQVELNRAPAFALLRADGGTIGLLSVKAAGRTGAQPMTAEQKKAIHLEFSTAHLDALYQELLAKGVVFAEPPHDEPWERAMTALDPDGYLVEFAEGRRGENRPARQAAKS
jgi:catechol 2,3-dioxygenase-like lactoylglutathione lyase family enzyme